MRRIVNSFRSLVWVAGVLIACAGCSKDHQAKSSSAKALRPFLGPAILQSNHADFQTEIRLLRNEIYSRYGRRFRDPMLLEYFYRFPWYKPSETYNDSLLSAKDFQDVRILQKYEEALGELDPPQQQKLKGIVDVFKLFKFRPMDTLLNAIGDIDGDGTIDTIRNHVYKRDDSIYIDAYWSVGTDTVRLGRCANPYFYLGGNPLFAYDTRDDYVILYTALRHSVTQISPLQESDRNLVIDKPMLKTAAQLSAGDLSETGENIAAERMERYLSSFRGSLVFLNQTEGSGSIQFWYAPSKRFVTFYRP